MTAMLHNPISVPAVRVGNTVPTRLDGITPPPWRDGALCAQSDPDAWFPDVGGRTVEVKEICHRCPLEQACLEWALANHEHYGVFGGKSERERRKIARTRREMAA